MNMSFINNYSALSQTDWIGRYDFLASKNTDLPEVESVSAIDKAVYDIDDVNYDRVKEYEMKMNEKNNTDKIDKKAENNDSNIENKANNIENDKTNKETDENKKTNGESLTEDEKATVEKLKARDTEVKAHEQAHLSVAGDLATSGASYTYQQGPDGKQYAVGGEVNIDTSTEDTYEETIIKMRQVIAAAMAPANPSGKDFSVAASARQVIVEMSSQIMQDSTNQKMETKPAGNTNKKTDAKSVDGTKKTDAKFTNNNTKTASTNTNKQSKYSNNINVQLDIYKSNNLFSFPNNGAYANFVV